MVSLSLICFKLLTGQGVYALNHFDLLTPKSIGIIYGSWTSMILRKVNLGEIIFKLMSGQDFANTEQMDGMHHNTIRPKVLWGI